MGRFQRGRTALSIANGIEAEASLAVVLVARLAAAVGSAVSVGESGVRADLPGQHAKEAGRPGRIRLVVDGVRQDGGYSAVRWRDVDMSVSVLVGYCRKK